MKSAAKLIRRFVSILLLSAVLLVIINVAVYAVLVSEKAPTETTSHKASIVTMQPALRYNAHSSLCSFAVKGICIPLLITSAGTGDIGCDAS